MIVTVALHFFYKTWYCHLKKESDIETSINTLLLQIKYTECPGS